MTPTPKPTDDLYRVFRGGAWGNSSAAFVRAAFRDDGTPSFRNYGVGFRCAQRGARMPLTGG